MTMTRFITSLSLFVWLIPLQAASPDWSVNPNSFVYSMSLTGPVNIDGIECSESDILVGAFVGEQCRGFCSLSLSADRYMAFLTIFGNNNGEEISLKAYLPEKDQVVELSNTLNFEINGILGTVVHPYILSEPGLSSDALFESFAIPGQAGPTIFRNDSIFVPLVYGTRQDSLIASFEVSPATRVFAEGVTIQSDITPLDYSHPLVLDVQSADETTWAQYTISVSQSNADITALALSGSSIAENQPAGSEIGVLATSDTDQDPHEYSLVEGEGGSDNGLFYLEDSVLYTQLSFDFETLDSYSIRIRTKDGRGSSLEQSFQIEILDANDVPVIEDQFFEVDENAPEGTQIGVLFASDEDQGQILHFILEEGNKENTLALDSVSGQLSVANTATLDFEKNPIFNLLIIVSDNGSPQAADTAIVHIALRDLIEGSLDCSNYLSPNGDAINDYWIVQQSYLYDHCHFRIFDANGIILLDQSGYQNDWDGQYNNEKLPEGAYFYVVHDPQNDFSYKGTITLIR